MENTQNECQSLSKVMRVTTWVEKVTTKMAHLLHIKRIDCVIKYNRDNENQISYCQKKKLVVIEWQKIEKYGFIYTFV